LFLGSAIENPEFPKQSRADIGLRAESAWRTSLRSRFGQTVSDKLALCQFGRALHPRLEILSAARFGRAKLLAIGSGVRRRSRGDANDSGTLHNMIVEDLSMPARLKEKLKPILAPKG
jgi:hypothetical protein